VAVDREMRQELFHLGAAHRIGMAQVMKTYEPFRPGDVAALGLGRVVPYAQRMSEAVAQPRRLGTGYVAERQVQEIMVEESECFVGLLQAA
jgi:hypothetical protein